MNQMNLSLRKSLLRKITERRLQMLCPLLLIVVLLIVSLIKKLEVYQFNYLIVKILINQSINLYNML